jgi:hypothetical protein
MTSAFSSLRIKKIEMWEFAGNPISLTWSASQASGPFLPGPDQTVTNKGSVAEPSHCVLVPKKGAIFDNWFFSVATTNVFISNINTEQGGGDAGLDALIRVSLLVTLNDANAITSQYTTTGSNTLTAGLIYWRNIASGSSYWISENYPSIATYLP